MGSSLKTESASPPQVRSLGVTQMDLTVENLYLKSSFLSLSPSKLPKLNLMLKFEQEQQQGVGRCSGRQAARMQALYMR